MFYRCTRRYWDESRVRLKVVSPFTSTGARSGRCKLLLWQHPVCTSDTKPSDKYTLILGWILVDTRSRQSCFRSADICKRHADVPPLQDHASTPPLQRARMKTEFRCCCLYAERPLL